MRISDWSSDVCSSDLQASKLSQLWGLIPGDHLDQRAFSHIEQRHVSRAVSDGLSNGVRELRRVGENDLLLGLEVVEQGAAREKGGFGDFIQGRGLANTLAAKPQGHGFNPVLFFRGLATQSVKHSSESPSTMR